MNLIVQRSDLKIHEQENGAMVSRVYRQETIILLE